jgi:aspartate/methionine/tyrosine aminotransferase
VLVSNVKANTTSPKPQIDMASNADSRALLSRRAQTEAAPKLGTLLWKVYADLWDPEANPNGYVSIGVAENRLLHADLEQHITRNMNVKDCAFTYGDGPKGSNRLRDVLVKFIGKHFKPRIALQRSHIMVTNGVTSCIEHMSWACANPGEAFLLGQPYYGAFVGDICLRPEVDLIKVKFGDVDPLSMEAVRFYEQAVLDAKDKGVTVKGLMLCNPHNPLGRCYARDVLLEYLKLCERYQIHFVSDEIYALTVWINKEDKAPLQQPFNSILSFDLEGVINPALVHVLWGTSKDWGANGLRVACIISQSNAALHDALTSVALFSSASSLADHAIANVLDDDSFAETYIAKNQQQLSQAYGQVVSFLRDNDIPYSSGTNAGFFIWIDLGAAYMKRHPGRRGQRDLTDEVMDALLDQKLYLASGNLFGSEIPGIFRVTFSHPPEYLHEGLCRMLKAIEIGWQGAVQAKL